MAPQMMYASKMQMTPTVLKTTAVHLLHLPGAFLLIIMAEVEALSKKLFSKSSVYFAMTLFKQS